QRDAAGDCRSAETQNFPPGYFLGHFHSLEINALLDYALVYARPSLLQLAHRLAHRRLPAIDRSRAVLAPPEPTNSHAALRHRQRRSRSAARARAAIEWVQVASRYNATALR